MIVERFLTVPNKEERDNVLGLVAYRTMQCFLLVMNG